MHGVLTLAGEGTRMLPWTRGLRKEFLPLYASGTNGEPVLKPVAHLALESVMRGGATEVTLVVSARDLTTAQNYFHIDPEFIERHAHHRDRLTETEKFYSELQRVKIRFAVQTEPHGFGDAVLQARATTLDDPFLLHAADATLLEPHPGALPRAMAELREREGLDAVLLVRKVADPRRYGVVEGRWAGRIGPARRLDVRAMEEKPAHPRSHWAATAIYAFSPEIFSALDRVRRRDRPKELELTAAIADILARGGRVSALVLTPKLGEWRSVGSVEGYLTALRRTRALAMRRPTTKKARRRNSS